MKVLVIEDELPAAKRLVHLLQSCDTLINIVGLIDSNESLKSWMELNPAPDLIFSDIELLDGQVFDALSKIQTSTPIIFTTAYDQFALKAFETSGISYLLKPYEAQDLKKAIDKFKSLKSNTEISNQTIETLKLYLADSKKQYKTKLSIKMGTGIYLLDVNEITSILTQNGIPYAFKEIGKKFPLSGLVSELEETLNPSDFFRINRSEIVCSHFIEKIEPYFNDRLAVKVKGLKDKLIVSGGRTPAFRKWLDQI